MDKIEGALLITGASGFIGEHIVRKLLKNNVDFGVLSRKKPLIFLPSKVNFHQIDLLNLKDVKNAVKKYDYIIHLAGRTGAGHIENPLLDFEINARGTLNLLIASRDAGVDKVIYASSAEVYGDPLYLPIDEMHPLHPKTPYAASKLTGENYCHAFFCTYGLKTIALRFFNIYGPPVSPQNMKGVVFIFTKQIFQSKPPMIMDHPENSKDYVFIDDIVNAIFLALNRDNCLGQNLNIGSGVPTTIKDLAIKLIEITGNKDKITPIYKENDITTKQIVYADIKKAKNILGYIPEFTIEDGLKKVIAWYSKLKRERRI